MKQVSNKLTAAVLAVGLAASVAASLSACGGDDLDITIHKTGDGTTVSETQSLPLDADVSMVAPGTDISSEADEPPTSSEEEVSSEEEFELPESLYEIPSEMLWDVEALAEAFSPQEAGTERGYVCEKLLTVDGAECYIIDVYDNVTTLIQTLAFPTDTSNLKQYVYDPSRGSFRVVIAGTPLMLGSEVASDRISRVETDPYYTFSYDDDAAVRNEGDVRTFKAPDWFFAIDSRPAGEEYDLNMDDVREALEESEIRPLLEGIGFTFDWSYQSDFAEVSGCQLVRRPLSGEHKGALVDLATVYYGYGDNGRFYVMVAYSTGETNSVDALLEGVSFS